MIEGMARLGKADPRQIGPYRLLGVIGEGSTGTVYLGRGAPGRRGKKQTAAVRLIRPELLRDRQLRARLRYELQTVRDLAAFPFLAAPLGCELDSERPWAASEFVPGPSLAELVARCGPLPEAAVRALGGALFQALSALHSAHVPHRDLRPCNVLLTAHAPRVVDHGLGLGAGHHPEDGLAEDVFQLGVTLAVAAGARHPFAGSVLPSAREGPDLAAVPVPLHPPLLACLHKVPRARPSPREMARALDLEDTAGLPPGRWLPEPHLRSAGHFAGSAGKLTGRRFPGG